MRRTEDQRIEIFNTERGMLSRPFSFSTANTMLQEEMEEFMQAFVDRDTYGMLDALADIVVVAKGEMLKLQYSPNIVMDETLKEIEDRTGDMNPVTGKWCKKLRGDEYKADYGKAYNG